MLPHTLDVLHHVIQGVPFGIFKALRAARTSLIDQNQLATPSQGLKRGEKVGVIGSGTAVQQQQWDAVAEGFEIDPRALCLHETFADP